MLAKFAVKNYRGFKDKIELDLSHPANFEFNEFAIKNGIVKNGIIYGPNGCGKTNLGLAIFDIVNHLSQKMRKPDFYSKSFAYLGGLDKYVEFEYTFKFPKVELFYTYSKDMNGALHKEKLLVNDKIIFDRSENRLIINNFPIEDEMKKQLASNANNVSIISFLLMSYPMSGDNYLILLKSFVDSMLWFRSVQGNDFIGLESVPSALEEFVISNDYLVDFQLFLKNVSGQDFHFIKNSSDDKKLTCEIEGRIALFDDICSTGTQSLLLLYYWTKKLEKASFVFIDEFDAFYHFKLSVEVCRLLFKSQCQVFFSSHNTYLMSNSLLRPDCNFIISDNKVKPLNDCTDKDLRFGHNIEKLYRGNIFSV